ncbi:unnamed protein product [marine sediment metagenome]|uniref:Uncharacterized protein n=1 Tax=marine sediment metagenome TaxID=412755 RepID=X1A6R9_9ZZZZ
MEYEKFVKSIVKDDSKPFKDVKDGIVLEGKKVFRKDKRDSKRQTGKKETFCTEKTSQILQ